MIRSLCLPAHPIPAEWLRAPRSRPRGGGLVTDDTPLPASPSAIDPRDFIRTLAQDREAATDYLEGAVVRPTVLNGHAYIALNDGTSGASEPVWPTGPGSTVVDNDITWQEQPEDDCYSSLSGLTVTMLEMSVA